MRLVLGWIAVPAALASLLWLPQARHTIHAVVPARASDVAVYRYALAWQVAAFMGLQSLLYFATLSWLPLSSAAGALRPRPRVTCSLSWGWATSRPRCSFPWSRSG